MQLRKVLVKDCFFFLITNIALICNIKQREIDKKVESDSDEKDIHVEQIPSLKADNEDCTFYNRILTNLNKNLDDPVSPANEDTKNRNLLDFLPPPVVSTEGGSSARRRSVSLVSEQSKSSSYYWSSDAVEGLASLSSRASSGASRGSPLPSLSLSSRASSGASSLDTTEECDSFNLIQNKNSYEYGLIKTTNTDDIQDFKALRNTNLKNTDLKNTDFSSAPNSKITDFYPTYIDPRVSQAVGEGYHPMLHDSKIDMLTGLTGKADRGFNIDSSIDQPSLYSILDGFNLDNDDVYLNEKRSTRVNSYHTLDSDDVYSNERESKGSTRVHSYHNSYNSFNNSSNATRRNSVDMTRSRKNSTADFMDFFRSDIHKNTDFKNTDLKNTDFIRSDIDEMRHTTTVSNLSAGSSSRKSKGEKIPLTKEALRALRERKDFQDNFIAKNISTESDESEGETFPIIISLLPWVPIPKYSAHALKKSSGSFPLQCCTCEDRNKSNFEEWTVHKTYEEFLILKEKITKILRYDREDLFPYFPLLDSSTSHSMFDTFDLKDKEEIRSKLAYFLDNLKEWTNPGKKSILAALSHFVRAAEEY
mmetsp:Transcript_22307/g.21547  ORF Transcript_22307/g.21547 Transcript_22307/m.21547 type:complete len:590 (-) Transcript_22307:23-1792(-)